ncbi:MAG: formyltransferase family protein [Alphaproteobacteria bacterium]
MRKLSDIGFIGVDSLRSRAYLSCLRKAKLSPSLAIIIENSKPLSSFDKNEYFDVDTELRFYFKEEEYISLETSDINSNLVVEALAKTKQQYWIYSGPSGVIVKENILSLGKKLLHIHPGKVPGYRGSTTIYYSILMENEIYCSAFFLSSKIDAGDLIGRKEFKIFADKDRIDYIYDPFFRASFLVDVISDYEKTGEFFIKKQTGNPRDFFIIHPVLKHLAILR